jgi:hypothetical protein
MRRGLAAKAPARLIAWYRQERNHLNKTMSLAAKTPVRLIEAQDLRLHVIKRGTHTARIHCKK